MIMLCITKNKGTLCLQRSHRVNSLCVCDGGARPCSPSTCNYAWNSCCGQSKHDARLTCFESDVRELARRSFSCASYVRTRLPRDRCRCPSRHRFCRDIRTSSSSSSASGRASPRPSVWLSSLPPFSVGLSSGLCLFHRRSFSSTSTWRSVDGAPCAVAREDDRAIYIAREGPRTGVEWWWWWWTMSGHGGEGEGGCGGAATWYKRD